MTRDQFNSFCAALPAAANVVQWGNASVWKVGGKIFAVCSAWGPGDGQRISFKCSDLSFSILIEQQGIRPAPYLGRAEWVQIEKDGVLTDTDLQQYIRTAHRIVSGKLTRAVRRQLGLAEQTAVADPAERTP